MRKQASTYVTRRCANQATQCRSCPPQTSLWRQTADQTPHLHVYKNQFKHSHSTGKDQSALLLLVIKKKRCCVVVFSSLQINDIVSSHKIICFNQYLVFSLPKTTFSLGSNLFVPPCRAHADRHALFNNNGAMWRQFRNPINQTYLVTMLEKTNKKQRTTTTKNRKGNLILLFGCRPQKEGSLTAGKTLLDGLTPHVQTNNTGNSGTPVASRVAAQKKSPLYIHGVLITVPSGTFTTAGTTERCPSL